MASNTTKSSLTLDLTDNTELQALLGEKRPGDRVELCLKVMVVANNDNNFDGDIESISVEGEEDEGEAEVSAEEPVMAVIASKSKRPMKEDADSPEDE